MHVLFFVIIKEVKIIKILLHTYVPHANYVSQKLATYFSHHRFRKLLLSFGDLFFMLFGSKVVLFDLLFCTKKGKKVSCLNGHGIITLRKYLIWSK